jgi:hypothetical protein
MELASEDGEHVHPGQGLALEKDSNIVAIYLYAERFLESNGCGLVGCLVEHGSEAEEFAGGWRIHDNLLVIFIDRGDLNFAIDQHVRSSAWIAHLIYALACRESFQLDLSGKDGGLFFIKQCEQGNVLQYFRFAGHKDLSE